jgi:oligosaccharide repeat unit polymerase
VTRLLRNALIAGLVIIIGLFTYFIFPPFLFSAHFISGWLLIFLGFGIFGFSYYKSRDIFNPIGIFSVVWLSTIGLATFRLSHLQAKWGGKTWAVVLGGYLAFLIGSYLAHYISKRKRVRTLFKSKVTQIDSRRMEKFILVLFIICFGSYIIDVIGSGYIPILAHKTSAYHYFGVHFIHYITVSIPLVNYLIIIYFLINKKIKLWMGILFIVAFLVLVSMMSRQNIIFLIIISIVTINYLYKRFKLLYILYILPVVLILFGIMGNMRSNSSTYIFQVGQINNHVHSSLFAWFYLYFAMSFENLRNYIENYHHLFYGAKTFFPVFAFTLTKKYIPTDFSQYLSNPYFTVSTMFYDFYLDFGYVGIIVFPLLIGLISMLIYQSLRKEKSLKTVIFHSFIIHNLIFSFFINFFSNTTWFFEIIVMILFNYYLSNGLELSILKGGRSQTNGENGTESNDRP